MPAYLYAGHHITLPDQKSPIEVWTGWDSRRAQEAAVGRSRPPLESILKANAEHQFSPRQLQMLRGLEVLERIGTSETAQLFEVVAAALSGLFQLERGRHHDPIHHLLRLGVDRFAGSGFFTRGRVLHASLRSTGVSERC
ncbi:MAG TPA: hypothetical protein VGY58_10435 [Gemmataceae bacterium]|nr:hypothetical protein [Gemmataceae bacterium]